MVEASLNAGTMTVISDRDPTDAGVGSRRARAGAGARVSEEGETATLLMGAAILPQAHP
jgi:hypothetical protein